MRLENSYSVARELIMKRFGVSRSTAERDLIEVDQLLLEDAKAERPMLRIVETQRLQRVALKAEASGEYSAVASLSREVSKINGLHAPKKIEHSGSVGISMHIVSLVGVLSPEGVKALELVQREIEAAKAKGLLPAISDPRDDEQPEAIDAVSEAKN